MSGEEIVTVSVWPLAVSAARLAALHAVLSADEQERARKIKLESVAREFVVSRGIARELLASACGCAPTEIVLAIGARGKPQLANPSSQLTFNLSHSSGYCALAVGNVARLGVDIEAIRPTIGNFANSVFSAREAAQYGSIDDSARMRTFFRGWVAKEAYLKATGEGLAGGLKSLELNLTDGLEIDPIAIRGDKTALVKWQFRGFDVLDTIVGAVAIEAEGRTVEVRVRHVEAERDPAHAH